MRSPRKLFIRIAAAIGVLIVLLAVLPYLFRDRIATVVQTEIAKSVNANVRWSGVGIDLFRHFPNVTLRLNDLSVVNGKPFEHDTLLAMPQFSIVIDLGSVLGNLTRGHPIVVRDVNLQQPTVRLRVLKDGSANWDIMRADASTPKPDASQPLAISLRHLAMHNAQITLDNQQSKLTAALSALDVTLNGDFTKDHFTLGTQAKAGDVSAHFAGIPYLDHVAVALNTDVGADMRAKRFTFTDANLHLNNLVLAFGGSVTLEGQNTALNLALSTPSTDFGGILSLVPAIYKRSFSKIQTTGTMSVSGTVKGTYGPKTFPALALHANVQNASFRYPDLPLPARDIGFDLAVDNPGGNLDNTVVNLSRFHVMLGQRPLDGRLMLRTPVSDPEVDLALNGSVDLADVQRTVELPDVKQLTGILTANLAVHTKKSWVDTRSYGNVSASGTFAATRVTLNGAAVPLPIAVDSMLLRFTPQRVELPRLVARVGTSDIHASGSLQNLIGFLLQNGDLRGQATVASNTLNLDEWRSDKEFTIIPVPPHVDFTLDVAAQRMKYGKLDIRDARGQALIKDQRLTLNGFRLNMLGGGVIANGYYETTAPARPTFAFDVNIDSMDIPIAFASLVTVQRLAPIAHYARGSFSSTLSLAGPLDQHLMPIFNLLSGNGSFRTSATTIDNFPSLVKLADAIHLDQIRNPTVRALQGAFTIEKGRLYVKPFEVKLGDMAMTVSGSNGMDQSLDYTLALALPTAILGPQANQAISALASSAGRVGINLAAATVVSIGARVTGTVTSPTVRPSFAGTGSSVEAGVKQAVQAQVETAVAGAKAKIDSAALDARRRASAQALQIVAEAEQRATAIRAVADSAAARLRLEAYEKAKALVAKTNNPALRVVAQAGADKLRSQADAQATNMIRQAGARADSLVAAARKHAAAIAPPDSL